MRLFALARLLLALSVLPTLAQAQIFVPDDHFVPTPPVVHPHPWSPPFTHHWASVEISSTKISASIRDSIAKTTVEEQLYNPNPQQLEGTFLLPVPKGAQLDKFTMEINGKSVEAELLGFEKARGIYEDIVRRMKDPALLEYAGRDLLKVRVFPIPGNSSRTITFSYTQVLKADSGLVSYVFPLNTAKFSAKPLKNVSVKLELDSKAPLKTIYSPSHTVDIRRPDSHHATVGFESSDARPDTDFELLFMPEAAEVGATLMTYKTGDEDGYFLWLASPGVDVKNEKIVAKDVAFVLDTSGSMSGNKLSQAKKAFQFCVENLNDSDRFELVRFSTDVEPLFQKLVDASSENRKKAEDFIKNLKPIGSTDISEALRQALTLRPTNSSRPYVVIFLTDGQPTVGETDSEKIIAQAKQLSGGHTRVFCFGIGTDVNTHLLDTIAADTGAFGQYVLPEEDIETKVSNFYSKIKEPVLANPRLEFPAAVHVSKMYPSPLPDLFKGDQLIVAGRYSGNGRGKITLQGAVNGQNRSFEYTVDFSGSETAHDFIPRLWATRRVGYLLDQIRLHGETAETRDEVTALARQFGIVTPFTAYLIVEDEKRRDVPVAVRSFQRLDKDAAAREQAKAYYGVFKTEGSGTLAVHASRQNRTLAAADNVLAVDAANSSMLKALPASPAPLSAPAGSQQRHGSFTRNGVSPSVTGDLAGQINNSARQTRFVAGRNFFQNGNQWIDTEVQKLKSQKPIRIQFNSKDYFEFATKNPRTLAWLALGSNVLLTLDGKVYEIYE